MKTIIVIIEFYIFIKLLITSYKIYKATKELEKETHKEYRGFLLYTVDEDTKINNKRLIILIILSAICIIM